jgi:hypothetical protein
LNTIIENKEIKIKVLPLCPVGPSKVLNSLWRVKRIEFHKNWNRAGINQNEAGIRRSPKKVLNQFSDRFRIVVLGSKTEKRFVIIFN